MLDVFRFKTIEIGNPNGGELPKWEAAKANESAPPVMVIDTESALIKASNDTRYIFLDNVYKM